MPQRTLDPVVYLLCNHRNGTLYVGVSSNLIRRVSMHQSKLVDGFSKTHNLTRLVYYEQHNNMREAIKREKQIKKWRRIYKLRLIESQNPTWRDLYPELFPSRLPDPPIERATSPASQNSATRTRPRTSPEQSGKIPWTPEQVRGDANRNAPLQASSITLAAACNESPLPYYRRSGEGRSPGQSCDQRPQPNRSNSTTIQDPLDPGTSPG